MESIINQKQKFITTKEDKLNHGIGLENVRSIVAQLSRQKSEIFIMN